MQASDVITREVVPVGPETPAEVVAGHGFAALPVVDGGRLGGVASRRDLRATVRPDEGVRHELLRRVEDCAGAPDAWDVTAQDDPIRAAPANA